MILQCSSKVAEHGSCTSDGVPAMAVRAPMLTGGKHAMDSCGRARLTPSKVDMIQQNNSREQHSIIALASLICTAYLTPIL